MKKISDQEKMIPINQVTRPKKEMRLEIDDEGIESLAASIDALGLMQAILVRPTGSQEYEIVYGDRRFLAHKLLGKKEIRCKVRTLDDDEVVLMRASENIDREDVSPVEEAMTYQELKDEHGLTVEVIAKRMGKTVGLVKRRLDLLRMPQVLQKAVHKKQIGYSVAEELWRLGDQGEIEYYLQFAAEHGATQAIVRGWVKDSLDMRRRAESGTGEARRDGSPMEPAPVYIACDTCKEPMQVGKESVIRCCPECTKAIKKALNEWT